jgi:hypothetical protein
MGRTFADSAQYQSLMTELKQQAIRPSHMTRDARFKGPSAFSLEKKGCIALFVGNWAVEKAAPWKSPTAGLSHSAWKSQQKRRSQGKYFLLFIITPTIPDGAFKMKVTFCVKAVFTPVCNKGKQTSRSRS